ncbi:MAG: hypothetical protein QM485_04950 [Flavobacteriaceae bacterium]
MPAFVKLSHAIHGHSSLECKDATKLHIHKAEFDCDFQKYQLSPQYVTASFSGIRTKTLLIQKKNYSHYVFLSQYQKLHFALRGPPCFS